MNKSREELKQRSLWPYHPVNIIVKTGKNINYDDRKEAVDTTEKPAISCDS